MNTKPILFSADMIRALLDGRKTQTRRIFKVDTPDGKKVAVTSPKEEILQFEDGSFHYLSTAGLSGPYPCPYGRPGDLLWVREAAHEDVVGSVSLSKYTADDAPVFFRDEGVSPWWYSRKSCPSIHMPRWASRLTLRITDVRVERVQDISEENARREGAKPYDVSGLRFDEYDLIDAPLKVASKPYKNGFALLWNSINAARGYGWDANPWVWAIEFEVIQKNIDDMLMEAA